MMCNYHCTLPIDNDDGSNAYVETNNWLLWGGTKSLMGYNKHFIVSPRLCLTMPVAGKVCSLPAVIVARQWRILPPPPLP